MKIWLVLIIYLFNNTELGWFTEGQMTYKCNIFFIISINIVMLQKSFLDTG